MTEAETLHKRKMQLKNDIVKPLLNLIDRGLDVPHILQDLASSKQDIIPDPKQTQGHY